MVPSVSLTDTDSTNASSILAKKRDHVHRKLKSMRLPALAIAGLAMCFTVSGCATLGGVIGDVLPDQTEAHVLVVGDCFNNTVSLAAGDSEMADVPRENCTLAHDNEVYESFTLTGTAFPGDEKLATSGTEKCQPAFEQFAGVPAEDAGTLKYAFFVPTAESWKLGDREVICYAFDSEQQTEYTLRDEGSKRLTEPATDPNAESDAG